MTKILKVDLPHPSDGLSISKGLNSIAYILNVLIFLYEKENKVASGSGKTKAPRIMHKK